MSQVRLVVIDDHSLFRAGLVSLLGEMPEFSVVGEAYDGETGIDVVLDTQPDIVLMDVNMPGMGGVETVRYLKQHAPCKIMMLTISKKDEDLFGSITAGADGYLLKSAEPEELRKAILLVHQGMSVLSPDVTRQVIQAAALESSRPAESTLSERELDILKYLAQGRTTVQIAAELYISENTVKTHVRHILEKLEAANRAEAVSKAIQMGLIRQEAP